jgi:Na+/phosphate symporter
VAISENKINRVNAVLAQALKRGVNLNDIITRAIEKKYKAVRDKDKVIIKK